MLRSGLRLPVLLALLSMLFGSSSSATDSSAAIGLRLSSMGFGGEIAIPLSRELSVRLGVDLFSYEKDTTIDEISYDLDAKLAWIPVLLDYNPGLGAFRLTAGMVISMNDVSLTSSSTETIQIGDHEYTPEQFGTLITDVDCRGVSPYLGIGLLKHIPSGGAVSIAFDFGAMFQHYKLTLSHEGGSIPPSVEEQFMEDLFVESQTVEDDLNSKFGIYPVIKIGVSFLL